VLADKAAAGDILEIKHFQNHNEFVSQNIAMRCSLKRNFKIDHVKQILILLNGLVSNPEMKHVELERRLSIS
jgi:hypothetical protein